MPHIVHGEPRPNIVLEARNGADIRGTRARPGRFTRA